MNISRGDLVARLRSAFEALPTGVRQQLQEQLRKAYAVTAHHLAMGQGSAAPGGEASEDLPEAEGLAGTEGLGFAYALLFEDPEGILDKIPPTNEIPQTPPESVDEQGRILWFGQYELYDIGWVYAFLVWLEHISYKAPFPAEATHVTIPDDTTLAIVGDWGTGTIPGEGLTPSLAIASFWRDTLKPDYTIHLGDTYYAGTHKEAQENFLAHWVAGTRGSFALNSNHEMYSGGKGYFETLLADPMFEDQKGSSHFALENSHWILVGLDSAYFADTLSMYSPGALDSEYQLPFLSRMAEKARSTGKKVIVMTHHNGFEYNNVDPTRDLWGQVLSAFPDGQGPDYWYWGHIHVGAAYPERDGVLVRCCGHGGMPWGYSTGLEKAVDNGTVTWFAQRSLPERPPQVMNGFVLLRLKGDQLEETFFDQTGEPSSLP